MNNPRLRMTITMFFIGLGVVFVVQFWLGTSNPFDLSHQQKRGNIPQQKSPFELQMLEQRIQSGGGKIEYEGEGADRRIVGITFLNNTVTDYDVQRLAKFPHLRMVEFQDNYYVSDSGISSLGNCRNLEVINLFGTNVGDDALAGLGKLPRLKELLLYRTRVSDKGVQKLANCQSLELLNLWDTGTTKTSLDVVANLKSLRTLCVGNSPNPHSEGMNYVAFPRSTISREDIAALLKKRNDMEVLYWEPETPEGAVKLTYDSIGFPRITLDSTRTKLSKVNRAVTSERENRSADWPSLFGPFGNLAVGTHRIGSQWDVEPPEVVWKIDAGEGYSGCVIADNTFLLLDRTGDFDRLSRGRLDSGEVTWERKFKTDFVGSVGFGNGPRSTPVVDGERIYTFTPNGLLRCHRLGNGEVIWQVDIIADFAPSLPMYGIGTTPLVYQDQLLVIIGNGEDSNDQALVSFNKLTGEVNFKIGDGYSSYASPKVVETELGPICFVLARHGLLAINLKTGETLDHYGFCARVSGCVNAATPVVHQDRVLISEAYRLGCVQLEFTKAARRFSEKWASPKNVRRKTLACHWNTPVVVGDFVYGCSGRHTNGSEIQCVDWFSGEVMWSHKLNERSSLIAIGKRILVVGESGCLRAFDAEPSELRNFDMIDLGAQHTDSGTLKVPTLTYPIWAPPAYSNGFLLVRGHRELVCIDLNK